MLLETLLNELNYAQSTHYHSAMGDVELEIKHLFRAARSAGVAGIYVFNASPDVSSSNIPNKVIADRPAVYVAEVENEEQARKIHRSLWNLGYAPFVIVLLPHQIRVYTGFDYSEKDRNRGLLDEFPLENLHLLLAEFSSEAVDSGHVWQNDRYKRLLDQEQRVDDRLLKNLRQLGDELKRRDLSSHVAHALIGKYVYFRYLWDRGILTEEWLKEQGVFREEVFSRMATVKGLAKLTTALEKRFNGKIFPINFKHDDSPADLHVRLTASIFMGDEIFFSSNREIVQQLHLDFQAYDFEYVPIEILSSVYEQFIEESQRKGAIYTPEILADYLLSEVNTVKPLTKNTKILDPACGSGVFLVLAFRRLIEAELFSAKDSKASPEQLKSLLHNLYGVERELDACYVAEFSLILTFLNYLDPKELQKLNFRFPDLHNHNIFHSDFFDIEGLHHDSKFWQRKLKFDWIVGNPPWVELKDNIPDDLLAKRWIQSHRDKYPVSGNRVAEAFSWLVTELLLPKGVVGLILPATSLFNLEARSYRQQFFTKHRVFRITNFSNLRQILFPKNEFPAFTVVFSKISKSTDYNRPIIHCAPLAVDQITGSKYKLWTITINEQEIQIVDAVNARTGRTVYWKLALWGTGHDKKGIEYIEALFPLSLADFCRREQWFFSEGAQLREITPSNKKELRYIQDLKGKKQFLRQAMRESLFHFSVPPHILSDIPDEMCYIRERGGEAGLLLTSGPHLILSPSWGSFATFSEDDFVVPPRVMGLAGAEKDANALMALAVYLNSSLASYYLFFHAQEWGVFRQAKYVSISEVRRMPVPDFKIKEINILAELYRNLAATEKQNISEILSRTENVQLELLAPEKPKSSETKPARNVFPKLSQSQKRDIQASHVLLQQRVDEAIFNLFDIPDDIRLLVTDFVEVRLPLDRPSMLNNAVRKPNEQELLAYASELKNELDEFMAEHARHEVAITYSSDLIECVIEITDSTAPTAINSNSVKPANLTSRIVLSELSQSLREQMSQWIYIQRGFRLFDGPRIYLYKSPRLIDWTRTQAMNDAGDIVDEVLGQL